MQELRANTQVIVTIGPFVDVGDGFTPQVDIDISGTDEAELMKHGATLAVDISGNTWAQATMAGPVNLRGYGSLTLTTTDTNTEGMLVVIIQDDSDCLPVKAEFMVLSEAAYDSKYVAKDDGYMDVNIKTIGRTDTTETEATNLEAACAAYSVTRGLAGTALPAAVAAATGGLFTRGTGAGQINQGANGRIDVDMVAIHGTALTETAGLLAAGFKKFFNVATPTGTINSLPDAVAGATNGLFIAGTNAATSITTALTANIVGDLTGTITGNITGNLSGSVGSLTGHTVQTGDSFGRIGATGSGLTSLAPAAGVALADGAITAAKIASNAFTAAKIATDAITATKIATGAIAADEIAGAACNKIADHVIRRSFVNACDSANGDTKSFRSLLGAVAKLVNKIAISGSTLSIYEEDDTTALGTQTVTTDEDADPATALDTV